jgi:hypothetical protein
MQIQLHGQITKPSSQNILVATAKQTLLLSFMYTVGSQRKLHNSNTKKCYTEDFHISQCVAALNAFQVVELLGQIFPSSLPASKQLKLEQMLLTEISLN